MLPEELLEGGSGLGGGELDSSRRAFRDARQWLERGPDIRREYLRVEAQFPEREGNRTPESTFSNEMERLLEKRGYRTPNLKQTKRTFIKDVEEYYYIDLEFDVSGTQQKMIDLLADLRQAGLQVKSFRLNKTNSENDRLLMDVIVSRLAKFDEDEIEKRRNDRRRGRRRRR